MASREGSQTNVSLLARLRQAETNQAAWDTFVERYGRKILRWCLQWGLQQADAQDVTQEVLLALARQMRTFEYDPSGSFRAWLKTVTYRAWCRFLEDRQRAANANSNHPAFEALQSESAGEDLLRQIEEEGERELLETAMQRVQQRVQPQTWEAFRLLAIDDLSGAEVARRLNMQVGAVYMAKSNVQKMLRDEVRRLEANG